MLFYLCFEWILTILNIYLNFILNCRISIIIPRSCNTKCFAHMDLWLFKGEDQASIWLPGGGTAYGRSKACRFVYHGMSHPLAICLSHFTIACIILWGNLIHLQHSFKWDHKAGYKTAEKEEILTVRKVQKETIE